jgi:hypothetical protein
LEHVCLGYLVAKILILKVKTVTYIVTYTTIMRKGIIYSVRVELQKILNCTH